MLSSRRTLKTTFDSLFRFQIESTMVSTEAIIAMKKMAADSRKRAVLVKASKHLN